MFVIIGVKNKEIDTLDIRQMDMYVRMFDNLKRRMKGWPTSKVNYFVSWRNWVDKILFNVIQNTIAKNFLKKDEQEREKYVSLCNDLVCRFFQVHAEIYDFTISIPYTTTESMLITDDLSIRCLALKWRTYFGLPYIYFLGEETILNASCRKIEEVGDTIALRLTEGVFEDIPSEQREKVVEYFRNWFQNFQSENCSERIF